MIEKVILAKPRGFCAGVERAIAIVEIALEKYNELYIRKEIVHNKYVVNYLRGKGALFVESLDEVPNNSTVIFSAHGVSPKEWEIAQIKNLKIIDATCPLVSKVHTETKRYAKENYDIILIGHKNHDEVIGILGEAPNRIKLIENIEDIENLEINNPKIVYLTQTTLSLDDVSKIISVLKKKFPNIKAPPKEDICYATQNRQNAVKELAKITDIILVIGSKNSSNSLRLVETALSSGVDSYLIENVQSINAKWIKNKKIVGITSGASAPEYLINEVVNYFKGKGVSNFSSLSIAEENIQFSLPKELKINIQKVPVI